MAERAHRLNVVQRFLVARIRQGVPLLQAVEAQHHRDRERPSAALRADLRIVGLESMIASNVDHGTTAAISAKNTSRFVRFFLFANSSDAKLNCASMPLAQAKASASCSGA
jgi:hypothetical protein